MIKIIHHKAIRTIATVLVGTLGGSIAFFLSLPIPWLLGSLVAVNIASSLGMKLSSPPHRLERWMRIMIGVSLGAPFALILTDFSTTLLSSLLLALFYTTLVSGLGFVYYQRYLNLDKKSSFLAAMPGGLSILIAFSGDVGKNFPKVALIHCVRIVLIVYSISLLTFILDFEIRNQSAANPFQIDFEFELIYLVFILFPCGVIANNLPIKGTHVIVSLLVSALCYHFQLITIAMPEIIKTLAFIIFGSLFGVEIAKLKQNNLKIMIVATIFTIVSVGISLILGMMMSWLTGHSFFELFLSLIPGGIAEISLIAFALGLDAGFVAAVHAVRFGYILIFGQIGLWRIRKKRN